MSTFKSQYVKETQRAKKAASTQVSTTIDAGERHIFSEFRKHAQEDFRTLTPDKIPAAPKKKKK